MRLPIDQEVHHFLGAEITGNLNGLLHRNLINGPVAFERHSVQKAQCASGNTDTAWREPAGLRQIDLIGTNLFRTEIFRPAVKVFCIGDDLLQVGRLGVRGEVSDTHVFEHPLA